MFFALDKNNTRVNAEDGEFSQCICPACGKPVRQRRGDINRHHFAHYEKEATCPYEYNKDYINMSGWHIRMQEYFPKDNREIIFTDKETGEKHIADVYLKESNTVFEFQYSSIKKKEFLDRTSFHLKEGRRMVWVFFEGWKNEEENKYYHYGKLDKARKSKYKQGPYSEKSFRWLYRKKYIEDGPKINQPDYCVCVYTDTEGDVLHKIIDIDEELIVLSLHDITMSSDLDVEEFFYPEDYWKEQEPWKSEFEQFQKENEEKRLFSEFIRGNQIINSIPQTEEQDKIENTVEYKKRYTEYEEVCVRIDRKIKERIEQEEALHEGRCPQCGGKLVMRSGKYGPFYGCSNFPRCKFTHDVTES